ncbi:MAG: hypothetical protein EOM37_10465 [Proteobacteria bacterium]|nr:hypothetical protein [Pseudomonadota bacterium]
MNQYLLYPPLDDFLYYRNIDIGAYDKGTFFLRPFTDEQDELYEWLVQTLENEARIIPIIVQDGVLQSDGYIHNTKLATYRLSDYGALIGALPLLRKLHDRQVRLGIFQEARL